MTKLSTLYKRQYVIFYISIVLATLLGHYLATFLTPIFEYNREAILSGQYWRLLTAHFVHLSWYHWWINIGGLALILFVLNPKTSWLNELCLWLMLTFGTSIGLLLVAPDLNLYVGLSGVLHGAFIVAIYYSPYYPRFIRAAIFGVLLLKLGWEFSPWYDDLRQLQQLGGRVEIRAHLIGSLLAIAWLAVLKYGHFNRRIQ